MNDQEIMSILPPAPAGVERWIRKEVVQNSYIIYSKKKNEAVCTRCGHKFRADRFDAKHDGKAVCPKCKITCTCKSAGIGRGKLTEYFRVLLFTHRGNTVYGTLHEIIADFKEPGLPQLRRDIVAVYVFGKDGQQYYRPNYYYDKWDRIKNIRLPRPPRGTYGTEARFERTVMYEKNLESVFKKSCLKYLWNPELFRHKEFTPYGFVRYISQGLKYPSIELLAKSGFVQLVADKVAERTGSGAVNWRGKTLKSILRLPMGEIRKLPRNTLDFLELETYKKMNSAERRMPWHVISRIAHTTEYRRKMIENTGTVDFITWAKTTEGLISEYDWRDYINDCKKLGLDIRKKRVLFPENFQKAHAELAAKVKVTEDKRKTEGIRKTAETFEMDVKSQLFILRIAKSQAELNVESASLSHCVRTYGDRVAAGHTVIYFIRKASAPDEPFYTLEINPDGKFIQCRGRRNCGMTEDVKAFVDEVVKEFNKMIKKKAREAA